MAELEPGEEFAGHRIEGVAGRGGMGVVYRATHLRLNRVVALKVIAPDYADNEDFRVRFKRESETAASLDQSHVLPIFDAGEAEGRLFITMRFVDQPDLRELIESTGRVQPGEAAEIVAQIGRALDAAHASGLVHRDVKPANILVSREGEQPHAYLTDFGLTKRTKSGSALTDTGMMVGTVDYVAPEQIQGNAIDGRADIYALAAVLYQALTGVVPYPKDTDVAKLFAHVSEPPPTVSETAPDLPPEFDEVVHRGMAIEPDERYQSAGDLGRAAVAAAAGERLGSREKRVALGAAAPSAAKLRPTGGPPRTLRYALAGLVALALLAGVLAVAGVFGGGDEPAPSGNPAGEVVGDPIPVGKKPYDVIVGESGVVSANLDGKSISIIDPETSESREIRVGGAPDEVVEGEGGIWAVNFSNAVTRIDPETEEKKVIHPGGGSVGGVGVGEGAAWVSDSRDNTVTPIDAKTLKPEEPIPVGDRPGAISVGDGNVFVTTNREVDQIAVGESRPFTSIDVGGDPSGNELHGETLWVITQAKDSGVIPFDIVSGFPGKKITVPDDVAALTVGEDSIWAVQPVEGTVTRFAIETGEQVGDSIEVGNSPQDVVVGDDGDVWVAVGGDDTVVKIEP